LCLEALAKFQTLTGSCVIAKIIVQATTAKQVDTDRVMQKVDVQLFFATMHQSKFFLLVEEIGQF